MALNEDKDKIETTEETTETKPLDSQVKVTEITSTTNEVKDAVGGIVQKAQLEAAEKDPQIQVYKGQYEKLSPELQQQCSWEELRRRLLANDGYYLTRAKNLVGGGFLFGVDNEGNPLFTDDCDGPLTSPEEKILENNYSTVRSTVMWERDDKNSAKDDWWIWRNEDRKTDNIKRDKKGNPVETDYKLFKIEEVKMYEKTVGKPFISNGRVWLENGVRDRSTLACHLALAINDGNQERKSVEIEDPFGGKPLADFRDFEDLFYEGNAGIRRLLRVGDPTWAEKRELDMEQMRKERRRGW